MYLAKFQQGKDLTNILTCLSTTVSKTLSAESLVVLG